jgi:hypothetical protein
MPRSELTPSARDAPSLQGCVGGLEHEEGNRDPCAEDHVTRGPTRTGEHGDRHGRENAERHRQGSDEAALRSWPDGVLLAQPELQRFPTAGAVLWSSGKNWLSRHPGRARPFNVFGIEPRAPAWRRSSAPMPCWPALFPSPPGVPRGAHRSRGRRIYPCFVSKSWRVRDAVGTRKEPSDEHIVALSHDDGVPLDPVA